MYWSSNKFKTENIQKDKQQVLINIWESGIIKCFCMNNGFNGYKKISANSILN